ncbi:hypothetical protein SAMN05444722_1160 [Rhodovulum sp. ES.010]|uniref:hypothetical protein n=1 Tax=Rhodovulum sp. ES.010 TaxID=1882821 RepID=UPI00092CD2E7|nr:hypothetical protein [Rhodovulum sp. ES.010]SIO27806.1 hypothetical protein SAMN05444722_1160 [Rhodovulum sp. ES.010]
MAGARAHIALAALGLGLGTAGCVPAEPTTARAPAYLGVETVVLDTDLVNMTARMSDPGAPGAVEAYARCAAAAFALGQGFGFLRSVRTNITTERGGVWVADAVYTLSPALPAGVRQIDAEVVLADCAGQYIPTV